MSITNVRGMRRVTEITNGELMRIERQQDFGYTGVRGGAEDFIDPVWHAQKVTDAKELWLKNPLANNIIETFLDYTLGDGITFAAVDEGVQDLLNEYYAMNEWEIKGVNRFRDLSLYGELLMVPFVSEHTGKVRITSLYSGHINDVKMSANDPETVAFITIDGKDLAPITYKPATNEYLGDCFFYQINKTTHQSRGLGDLQSSRDWLQLYDKALYSSAERIGLLLSFIWDVELKDANEGDLKRKLHQILLNPPAPGSTRVHNQNEVWKTEAPALNATELTSFFDLILQQPMAGARHPKMLFGNDPNANRASAYVLREPYFKKAKRRQRIYKQILSEQFDYAIWNAQQKNMIPANADTSYKIITPEPNPDIADALSSTLQTYANSITLLETGGYISKTTAKALVGMIVGQLGIEQSEDEEEEGEPIYDKIAAKLRVVKK
jgi:hypothetical protein